MTESVRPLRAVGDDLSPIIAHSLSLKRAVSLAQRFARSPLPILLVGPTGSGKELFAQHIHRWSSRRGALIDVNCGALPREMIESLLFGHRRGTFTGAIDDRVGLIEAAAEGTLFLDELASLELEGQAKLLRALETGTVRRLGETGSRMVSFRLVAAVSEDLTARVEGGSFRRDLLQRVAGVVIRLPALAERPEDLWPLAYRFAAEQGKHLLPEAAPLVERYSWPGNVRELRAAIERAAVLAGTGDLTAPLLAEAIDLGATDRAAPPAGFGDRARLLAALEAETWHAGRAAERLGMSRSTLFRRMKELDLSVRQARSLISLRRS